MSPYSYKEKKKAVDLYLKHNESYSTIQKILGYPNSLTSIKNWVKEFKKNNSLSDGKTPKYTLKERKRAVAYFLKYRKSNSSYHERRRS